MSIFLFHFIPFIFLSALVIHFVFRRRAGRTGIIKPGSVFLFIIAVLIFRPFIEAMWMFSAGAFLIFMGTAFLWAAQKPKTWPRRIIIFARTFILWFPFYLAGAILMFSITNGQRCDDVESRPGVHIILSLCTRPEQEAMKKYTRDIFHCRNAFLDSTRKGVYCGFGAETNTRQQVLIQVDRDSNKIGTVIKTKSVFRGYCRRENDICIFLVSPSNTIRLWDDRRKSVIAEFRSPGARPRFLSVAPDGRTVYVISDRNWIAVVDLVEKKITKKIVIPGSTLLTVDNTVKRVVATSANLFNPFLYVIDKKTGKVEKVWVGLWSLWKNLGYFFHVTVDPTGEKAFVAAPFECAVYMIDLKTKRVVWKQRLPIGIRDLTFDTKRKLLYASNFVDGYAYIIDTSGDAPRRAGKIFLGRRLRYINYEQDEDILLAASTNGFIMIDPKKTGIAGSVLRGDDTEEPTR